jgi:hypothetical protein
LSNDFQPPGVPPFPQDVPQMPGPPPFVPPPVKKSNTGKIVAFVVGGVVLLGLLCVASVVLLAVNVGSGRVENAKVGDCMPASVMNEANTSVDGAKLVDCTSAEADQRVVGIVSGKKESEVTPEAAVDLCAPYPTAESFVWIGRSGKAGDVFCLEPVKK